MASERGREDSRGDFVRADGRGDAARDVRRDERRYADEVDEMSLKTQRRAIAYGRARGRA